MPSRSRRYILTATAGAFGLVAGCSALSSGSSTLDLTLFNHSDTPFTVELTLLNPDGDDSRSDARNYNGTIDVDAQGEAQRSDIATAQPYLVRYELYENNNRLTDEDHVHYYPSGSGDDELTFDIESNGILTRR